MADGPDSTNPRKSALGGARNEAGSAYRAGVAARYAAFGLAGRHIEGLGDSFIGTVPELVELEADEPVDDIVVTLSGGGRLLIQAKSSITKGLEFEKVVAQWKEAATSVDINPAATRLVLASEDVSGPLRALGSALNRRRMSEPSSFAPQEQDELTYLEAMLDPLDGEAQERLLTMAVVSKIMVLGPNAPDRESAESILESSVVTYGDGKRAFKALDQTARNAAVLRRGHVIAGWLEALTNAGLALREDPNGAPSARHAAAQRLIQRHKRRLVERGTNLDLRPLGIELASIPLRERDMEWDVEIQRDDDCGTTRSLRMALQRRGRAILTGLPGSGKSSALQQLAADLAGEDGPIPVYIPLRRVDTEASGAALEKLIDAGLSEVEAADRQLLTAELVRLAKCGSAVLLLDGLDECGQHCSRLVQMIEHMARTVDPATDVLLATRDTAYAMAATLRWKAVKLCPPRHLDGLLMSVAARLAALQGIPEAKREPWAEQRMAWLNRLWLDVPTMKETPLLSILALALFAGNDDKSVPRVPALILSKVIDEATRRIEIDVRSGHDTRLDLPADQAAQLLTDGFNWIGHELFSNIQVSREGLVSSLTRMVVEQWGYPIGPSKAYAKTIVDLWDEAGVFVARGSPATVSARIQTMAEIAEARHAALHNPERITRWLTELAQDPDRHRTVGFAASLSSAVANALVEVACAEPGQNLDLLAGEAMAQGASPDQVQLSALVELMVQRQLECPDIRRAELLARVRVPPPLQDSAWAAITLIEEQYRPVLLALAANSWGIELVRCEATLRDVLNRRPPGRLFVDEAWTDAVTGSLNRLLGSGVVLSDAEILSPFQYSSMNADKAINRILSIHGRSNLVAQRLKEMVTRFEGSFATSDRFLKDHEAAWQNFLATVSQLGSRPLTPNEARRLDELADLVTTLQLPDLGSNEVIAAMMNSDAMGRALQLVVELGQFDPSILGAEAELFAELAPANRSEFLSDAGTFRELSGWPDPPRRDLARQVAMSLFSEGEVLAILAYSALVKYPWPSAVAADLDALISRLPARERFIAASLLLVVDSTRLRMESCLSDGDGVVAIAAAEAIARHWQAVGDDRLLRAAMTSPDGAVRSALIVELAESNVRLPEKTLVALDEDRAEYWTCKWCGEVNETSRTGCSHCRIEGVKDISPGSELRRQVAEAQDSLPARR